MTCALIVIHPGALGDVLLAVPAMKHLRERLPEHEIFLCAAEEIAQLLADCGVADGWSSIDGSACAELLAGTTPVAGPMVDWLARCDAAVAWLKDEQGHLAATLRQHHVQEVRICSPFSPSLTAKHQSDRFLETVGELPLDRSSCLPVQLPDHLIARGRTCLHEAGVDFDRPLAVVHPGSGSLHKCVRPDILAGVIEGLWNDGAVPLLLEGPADAKLMTDVLKQTGTEPVVLRGLDLMTLAGILAKVQLFIGHDSGISHLSAFLGTHTVALFGPTVPDRWAPIGPHVRILRGRPCSCPDWQSVSRCMEKPCLHLSPEAILTLCRSQFSMAETPRQVPHRLVSDYLVC